MADVIISREDARAQGLSRYFLGEPCKHGHIAPRVVSSTICCTCNREFARLRYQAHPRVKKTDEERRAYQAAWFQANKERVRAQRLANPNSSKSSVASAKRWVEANPEKAREYARMNRRNRRALAKAAGGTHTEADLAEIFAAQKGRCAYCKIDLTKTKKHVDHIIPLVSGGSNGRSNLQYACSDCNVRKNAKDPIAFAQTLGLLL